jgi:cold shock CspA family protein
VATERATHTEEASMRHGYIKWFRHDKGFGFIRPSDGSPDCFLHESEVLREDLASLDEGVAVEFDTTPGARGPAAIRVRRTGVDRSAPMANPDETTQRPVRLTGLSADIQQLFTPSERRAMGIDGMAPDQQRALLDWGRRLYVMGEHRHCRVKAVKYDGRLIVLDNDSRWEVDRNDQFTASQWSSDDEVFVNDGRMYKLDQRDSVEVKAED